MGNQRRLFEHNALYMVSNRIAEGLPLVANEFFNLLIYGVLARAHEAVPDIEIGHFQFMGNHYHGFIVPRGDPKDVSRFLLMLDAELAKIIAKVLGKRNHRIWAQRAHVAKILTYEAAIREMAYLYLNPVAAHLVESVEDWRGVSTWEQVFQLSPIETFAISRAHVSRLPNRPFRKADVNFQLRKLMKQPLRPLTLNVHPFGFKSCFLASQNLSDEAIREQLVQAVRDGEGHWRKERKVQKRKVVGTRNLAEQNPYKPFKPAKFSRRVFCISTDNELRLQFIEAYRTFCRLCEEAYANLLRGLPAVFPPGAFIPGQSPFAHILPTPL